MNFKKRSECNFLSFFLAIYNVSSKNTHGENTAYVIFILQNWKNELIKL